MENEKKPNRNRTRRRPPQEPQNKSAAELKTFIQSSLRDIRENENPKELNKMRALFRKHVPLPLRSYFAAYLLKHGNFSALSTANNRKRQYKRLFLNAGKQHSMTVKSVRELFTKIDGMQKADLGNISIHNMFSFVDVSATFADTVISTLSGSELDKDRKLVVNYAKKKR